ncbi:MAG: FAD-dependent oxidoreductase, partial [Cytophagales bacterium]|nr:FAD-dependent oxidoreductase [Cytophaga sp.]
EDPYHYFRTQEVDGAKYLIAGGEDHKTAHEENTESCFLRLQAYVKTYFNVDEVSFKWSSQYFEPADGLPYIGHLPGNPEHVYVATGFGGNGMIYGTMAATILTELIVKGDSLYKKLLNPSRIKPVASFGHIVKEGADVAAKLMSRMIPADKLEELADLAPGEAKVVRYEKETIALFKDEIHNLHAVSSICPHMKCSVSWNTAEQSWDCPCHGSRFSCDGEILTAPCLHALEKINIIAPKEN